MKLILILAILARSLSGQNLNSAVSQTASGTITTASTSCTATACVFILAPSSIIPVFGVFGGAGIVTVKLSGTFVATVQMERSVDGSVWTPYSSGTTAAAYPVILNNGTRLVRARASAFTSGPITVAMAYGWSTDDSGVLVWPGGFSAGTNPIGGGATFATPAAVQAYSATPTFDLKTNNTYEVTLTGNVSSVSFLNPVVGQVVLLKWIQDGAGAHTVTYGSAVKTCDVVSAAGVATIQLLRVAADGVTIEGFGCPSDAPGLVTAGGTAAAPATPASGVICWLDSTANTLQCKDSAGIRYSTVKTASGATANQWVDYVATTGIPHTSRPACADLSDSGGGCKSGNEGGFTFVIDGGGSAITTGSKGYINIPYACTITRAVLLADQSGSIVVDIKRSTYSGFASTSSLCSGGTCPTLAAAIKSTDSTLTSWTKTLAVDDVVEISVTSVATVTRVTVGVDCSR